ncbi:MAG: dUTP diphosphatase [Mycoplasma sp.]
MKLKIKKIDKKVIGIKSPALDGDAGYDIHSAETVTVPAKGSVGISTKVSVELPEGYWLEIMPKSGLATKYSLAVHNGVVDNGYRGEVIVFIYNHGDEDYTFQSGDKVAQCIIRKLHKFEIEEVDELSSTTRGEAGFGSTGK